MFAPVSRYNRKCPTLTVEKTSNATALPIDAIAV